MNQKIDYVLLAAGNGKRLWPITEHQPKTMCKVLERPLLEWMVDAIYKHANKIIVIVGAHKAQVISHFENSKYSDKIVFVEQTEQKGTGHAVLQAEKHVTTGRFTVLNADTFSDPGLYQLIETESSNEPFIVGKMVEDGSKYGVLVEDNGKLVKIMEKPPVAPHVPINTGAYCVPLEFFSYLHDLKLSPRGEYEVTDALTAFANDHKVKVLRFDSYWNDVGYFWNLLDVNNYALEHLMTEKTAGNIEKSAIVNGKLHLGKNSKIMGPSRIEGSIYIGENCSVGPGAFLKDCVIESNCSVANSEVKRSVLSTGTKANHYTHIADSFICEEVNFGAGSQSANLRFDKKTITVEINDAKVESGKKKLGCVVGKGTNIGCNAVIYPGKLIGSNCTIYPNATVDKNLESDSTFK